MAETISTETIQITPHKSLYRKMGRSSHGFNESISEFVDNSIDAGTDKQKRGKEPLKVAITLDVKNQIVEISDNAAGMSRKEAGNAIVLAESSKTDADLGQYGFGLKTAALSIGRCFYVITGIKGNKEGNKFTFDEEDWENNPELDWHKFPLERIKKPVDEQGTNIRIEGLKVKLTHLRATNLKKDLGQRFASFIRKRLVDIRVNRKKCVPYEINWAEGYPIDITVIDKKGNKIPVTVGLMVESSQKGQYGFDLFRGKRLVRTFEKFAIPEHATSARIRGEIQLDHVPITHEKNRFIEDSEEYELTEEACKAHPEFLKIIRLARKKAKVDKVTPHVEQRTKDWEDNIAKALQDPDIKLQLNPTALKKGAGNENPAKAEDGTLQDIEIEKRDSPENTSPPIKEPESSKDRTPQKTHRKQRHIFHVGNKIYKLKHEYKAFGVTAARKESNFDKDKSVLEIFTNVEFPAFFATNDIPFYAAFNISEEIAATAVNDQNLTYDQIDVIKDNILRKASEFKNELVEKKPANKGSDKNFCVSCGVELPFKSKIAKYCSACTQKKQSERSREWQRTPEGKQKLKEYWKEHPRTYSEEELTKLVAKRQERLIKRSQKQKEIRKRLHGKI